MKGSGLEQILGAAFGGLPKILNGKAWTNVLKAYRIGVTVFLFDNISENVTERSFEEFL